MLFQLNKDGTLDLTAIEYKSAPEIPDTRPKHSASCANHTERASIDAWIAEEFLA